MDDAPVSHRGFTLLEIIVAMAVGGMVMLGARQLFDTLTHSVGTVERYTSQTAREANGEALLRELVRRAEVGLELPPFDGTAVSAHFSTWCDVPGGWSERCSVSLVPNASADQSSLVTLVPAPYPSHARLLLGDVRRLIYFDGLNVPRQWKRIWPPGNPLPLALGLVRSKDTLILRIGQRG